MSLDFYLEGEEELVTCKTTCRCGRETHTHTYRARPELFTLNITHNLGAMAKAVGIYKYLWCPGENGIVRAAQLLWPLQAGLALLCVDPERFQQYNAANKWWVYEDFVPFVKAVLDACREYPDAYVRVSV